MKRYTKKDLKIKKLIKFVLKEDFANADKVIKSLVHGVVKQRIEENLDKPFFK